MNDCDVCIGGSVEEYYENYERDTIKTPADTRCCECYCTIPADTDCERATGEFFDEKHEHITCLTCVEVRDVFSCGEAVSHEGLWEDMHDIAFPELTTASKCFVKLGTKAKTVVLARWNDWKFNQ